MSMSKDYNATIVQREVVRPGLVKICVRMDDGSVPEFVPGQAATLALPDPQTEGERLKLIRRQYSVCSPPGEDLQFLIIEVDHGHLSHDLTRHSVGTRLFADDRLRGRFTLEALPDDRSQDVVMVATGTGLAPYLSMIHAYATNPPWRRCVLIHGVRHQDDLADRRELEAMQQQGLLHYLPAVTRPSEDWQGHVGRVQSVLEGEALARTGVVLNPIDARVYLCGSPRMVEDCAELLERKGYHLWRSTQATNGGPDGTLHYEKYW